jgi:hypothetical protein
MTPTSALIEPSCAEAIAIIAAASELREQTRRHWTTSLRQMAKALDRPLEVIPARYSAVRADLDQLHEAPAGLTTKTLRNHKSNAKAALLWLAREKGIPRAGAPLTPAWEELRAKLNDGIARSKLSSFMRFCAGSSIAPADVDEAVVDRFIAYRAGTGKSANDAVRRLLARAWNANVGKVPGWPACRLVEPPVKAAVELPWEAFPQGLQRDRDRYLESLTHVRRGRTGKRIRPLQPSTLRQRRVELLAAARMAVKEGIPLENLNSLSALLAPEVAEKVLDAYWRRNGENPKLFTIYLACRFIAIAKEMKCLDEEACERLEQMRRDLEDHRRGGLTDKNIAFIRQVLTPGVWERVVKLPFAMMASARRLQHQPIRAAVTAQLAVAIASVGSASTARESHRDQARDKPDQAEWTALEPLAGFPGLRREEPRPAGVPAGAIPHTTNR